MAPGMLVGVRGVWEGLWREMWLLAGITASREMALGAAAVVIPLLRCGVLSDVALPTPQECRWGPVGRLRGSPEVLGGL